MSPSRVVVRSWAENLYLAFEVLLFCFMLGFVAYGIVHEALPAWGRNTVLGLFLLLGTVAVMRTLLASVVAVPGQLLICNPWRQYRVELSDISFCYPYRASGLVIVLRLRLKDESECTLVAVAYSDRDRLKRAIAETTLEFDVQSIGLV